MSVDLASWPSQAQSLLLICFVYYRYPEYDELYQSARLDEIRLDNNTHRHDFVFPNTRSSHTKDVIHINIKRLKKAFGQLAASPRRHLKLKCRLTDCTAGKALNIAIRESQNINFALGEREPATYFQQDYVDLIQQYPELLECLAEFSLKISEPAAERIEDQNSLTSAQIYEKPSCESLIPETQSAILKTNVASDSSPTEIVPDSIRQPKIASTMSIRNIIS